jgi:hypothetical protein
MFVRARSMAYRAIDGMFRKKVKEFNIFSEELGPTCIIFSKNRPMQLDALIRSLRLHMTGLNKLHIVYASSDDRFASAYKDVSARHQGPDCIFHVESKESNFNLLVKRILCEVYSRTLFFLVDDIIVTRDIDLRIYSAFADTEVIPSLRLGRNITWNYMGQTRLPNPPSSKVSISPSQVQYPVANHLGDMMAWRWRSGQGDWGYPLSVDGNIFVTNRIREIILQLVFNSPNTLEAELQPYANSFSQGWGICRSLSSIVNLPLNRVQIDFDNRFGDVPSEYLLEKWFDGLQIDVAAMSDLINSSVHQEIDIKLEAKA